MTAVFTFPSRWAASDAEDPERMKRLKRLGRMANGEWLERRSRRYPGWWVVVSDGRLVGKGLTRVEAVQKARRKPLGADLFILRIPTREELGRPENIW
jgi:hypothetical protein